jgi:DNA-binding beta-propeller fold protein YncE
MSNFIFILFVILVPSLLLESSNNISKAVSSISLSNFTFVKKIPQDGTSAIQILQPEGIDIDSEGNLYVNDIESNSIKKFSKNGSYILNWGSTGSGDGEFNHPHGNEVDQDGNVYVTDQGNARVQKFTGNGKFITSWGTHGTGDGQFTHPHGIAIDSKGNVFVSDRDSATIQKFTW